MPTKVLLVNTAEETVREARELTPPDFELIVAPPGGPGYAEALADTEYLLGNVSTMDEAFYRAAPSLKLVQLLSAGYDDVDLEAARRAKVPVSNNGGANAISVSEHAMMLMLTVARKVVWQHASVSGEIGRAHV